MKVIVNGEEVIIFRGATVSDAVRNYSEKLFRQLKKGELIITDRFGNLTEPDGELTEGEILILTITKSSSL
jgi:hypothetical protein